MLKQIILIIALILGIGAVLSLTIFKNTIKAVFYIDHMERDARINRMNIDVIVSKLKIEKGQFVADIGAGSGLFSRKFSEKTGSEGRVFAVDINPELLKHIEKINNLIKINNIKIVLASENDPSIPKPVDLIFICDTLHYIDHQGEYVKTMARYLKKGGRIAIVSFYQNWPPMANQFYVKDLDAWMETAGMQRIKYYDDFIQDEYFAVYQ